MAAAPARPRRRKPTKRATVRVKPTPSGAAPARGSEDVTIDWECYEPGDVFATTFAGLSGFEDAKPPSAMNTERDPFVTFDRREIEFPDQEVKTTSPAQTIDLLNSGGSPATIIALDSKDPGADFEFDLRPEGGFPVQVPAYGEIPLADVCFAPRTPGEKSVVLTIDDGTQPSPELILRATAIETPLKGDPSLFRRADDPSQWERGDLGLVAVTVQPTDADTWPIARIGQHTVGLILATLTNYSTALSLFDKTLTMASLEEANLASTLSVAGDALRKAVLDKLIAFVLKGLPGASIVGDLAKLGDFDQKGQAALKAAKAARTENAIKLFLTSLIKQVGDARSAIEANEQHYIHDLEQAARQAPKLELFRLDLLTAAANHEDRLRDSLSSAGLFNFIAARWIHNESRGNGHVEIHLRHDFSCIAARLFAPSGARIAEGLLEANGAKVDLDTLPVERKIYWFPDRTDNNPDSCRQVKAVKHRNGDTVVLTPDAKHPTAEERALFRYLCTPGLPTVTTLEVK